MRPFVDDFLLYDGCNMHSTDDGSLIKAEREGGRVQHITEKSGSDCTSVDGGSRDDSTDEGGDDAPTLRHPKGVSNGTPLISDRHLLNGEISSILAIPNDGMIDGNFSVNNGDVNNGNGDSTNTKYMVSGNDKKKRGLSKSVTEDQKVERRDRNREHAKRSRLRKKSMLKSLQSSLEALQRQNNKLKMAITEKVQSKSVLFSL